MQQPNPLLRIGQPAEANPAGSNANSPTAASSLDKAAAAYSGETATAGQLSNLSVRTRAGAESTTGVEAVPSSPASAKSPDSNAASTPNGPAIWQKGVGGVSSQYRIWTAAGVEFKSLLNTASSLVVTC